MIVQQFGDSLLADASHGMMERIPFPSTVISRCVLLYVLKRFIMEVIMMTARARRTVEIDPWH
jgi:hypothetical protein